MGVLGLLLCLFLSRLSIALLGGSTGRRHELGQHPVVASSSFKRIRDFLISTWKASSNSDRTRTRPSEQTEMRLLAEHVQPVGGMNSVEYSLGKHRYPALTVLQSRGLRGSRTFKLLPTRQHYRPDIKSAWSFRLAIRRGPSSGQPSLFADCPAKRIPGFHDFIVENHFDRFWHGHPEDRENADIPSRHVPEIARRCLASFPGLVYPPGFHSPSADDQPSPTRSTCRAHLLCGLVQQRRSSLVGYRESTSHCLRFTT